MEPECGRSCPISSSIDLSPIIEGQHCLYDSKNDSNKVVPYNLKLYTSQAPPKQLVSLSTTRLCFRSPTVPYHSLVAVFVGEFKPYVPLIAAMRQPGMRPRHWDQLSAELDMNLHLTEDFTLAKAIDMGLLEHLDVISTIADTAGKEYAIEMALGNMEDDWKDAELQVLEYKETGTYIMKVDEAILQKLDDHIAMTQSISFSPFKKPFEERIAKWEAQLVLVSEIIDEWFALQRQWMYLEPIFSSADIQTQLPIESKRFNTVNTVWRKALGQAHLSPHILTMCSSKKLLEQFRESNKLIDMVQKGLADYLETKRLAFSRFFFLSNDELLQILSQAKNPLAVQPHLRKCFEAISELDFKPDLEIVAINSIEGEKVNFTDLGVL
eukprot:Gb_31258 [translate_table: standard]